MVVALARAGSDDEEDELFEEDEVLDVRARSEDRGALLELMDVEEAAKKSRGNRGEPGERVRAGSPATEQDRSGGS